MVGMGPTKTITKLANFAAKKWKHTGGESDDVGNLLIALKRAKILS